MSSDKPTKPIEIKNEAQRQLRLSGLSVRDIAKKIEIGRGSADRYLKGDVPAETDVRVRFEKVLGIPVLAWDAKPKVFDPPPSRESGTPSPTAGTPNPPSQPPCPNPSQNEEGSASADEPEPTTALEAARAHLARCRRWRQEAERGKSLTAIAKAAALEEKAIRAWGTLTGEMKPGDEAKLTTSTRFLRIQRAIGDALVKYPDALMAVCEALAFVEPEAARELKLYRDGEFDASGGSR